MPEPKLTFEQIKKILNSPHVKEEIKAPLRKAFQLEIALDNIVTSDSTMLQIKEEIKILAFRPESVLILGETGTGKSQIAKALHGNREGRFILVNCSSLPAELIESELFGHTAGAFTGAINKRDGKFIAARNGTLFLDEIGDMPLEMQCKLLIALQEKTITPLGSNDTIEFNCRVVAATNQDITKLVNEGKFRSDLFYRLSIFALKTTPLRSRRPDILTALDNLYDTEKKLSMDIKEKILTLPLWGNYRELEAIVLRYLVLNRYEETGTHQRDLL